MIGSSFYLIEWLFRLNSFTCFEHTPHQTMAETKFKQEKLWRWWIINIVKCISQEKGNFPWVCLVLLLLPSKVRKTANKTHPLLMCVDNRTKQNKTERRRKTGEENLMNFLWFGRSFHMIKLRKCVNQKFCVRTRFEVPLVELPRNGFGCSKSRVYLSLSIFWFKIMKREICLIFAQDAPFSCDAIGANFHLVHRATTVPWAFQTNLKSMPNNI